MRIITTILISLCVLGSYAQNNHIIITEAQANQIRGHYGIYSEIQPVLTFDGEYIIPEKILDDPDLAEIKNQIDAIKNISIVQDIKELPGTGKAVYKDSLYLSSEGLVKCRQTHNMTIYQPSEVPALFSFFRENTDSLEWIPNEEVKSGWFRFYEGTQYECIQSHMTLESWNPVSTLGVLWKSMKPPTNEWAIGVSYKIGDVVLYKSKTYQCRQAHTSISTWTPDVVLALWLPL